MPTEPDRLSKGLNTLEVLIKSMGKGNEEISRRLTNFDEMTTGLAGKVCELQSKIEGLRECQENITATKKVVDTVTAKFNNIEKAKSQLNKGSSLETEELLATCDALREAVRHAQSLCQSTPDSRSYMRLEEQQSLLDVASTLLDNRFRGIITTQVKTIDFKTTSSTENLSFMGPNEVGLLVKIVSRIHNNASHYEEFSAVLQKAINTSVATCTETVIAAAEEGLKEKKRKEFYPPGSHACLSSLWFYKRIIVAATSLGKSIFGETTWISYQKQCSSEEARNFHAVGSITSMLQSVANHFGRCPAVDQIYVYLDVLKVFFAPEWDETFKGPDWTSMSNSICTKANQGVQKYLAELRHPTDPAPPDGTVYSSVLSSVHLLARILRSYGEHHFNIVASREQSAILTFRDFFSEVMTLLGTCINDRSEQLASKRSMSLPYVFRLNNNQYLYSHMIELNVSWVTEEYCPELMQEVETLKAKYLKMSWNKMASVTSTEREPAPLSSDTKDWIKKRFKHFNEMVETRVSEEHGYNIPNPDLKRGLRQCVADYVLLHYSAFHAKYAMVAFSRTPERYIKYAPDRQNSRLLDATGQSVMDKLFTKQ
eukprot:TRINITY_DN1141_c5_g1_i1.p1 TRINITY_DN1141_c5_g1~~TRINITY_DN1141_c5_g1_i1.p1  ORF type:complete len:614 (+),score=78.70 TRINITY_DN1141_c5_g1_i1:49-1842(+)